MAFLIDRPIDLASLIAEVQSQIRSLARHSG
mgnify:CR=1 FL=1